MRNLQVRWGSYRPFSTALARIRRGIPPILKKFCLLRHFTPTPWLFAYSGTLLRPHGFRCTRYTLPYLKETNGAICNTTTPGGKAPAAGGQPTALSRASGISLTKSWSKEFAEYGVRVNTVCVGVLKSRQHQRRWEAARERNPDRTLEQEYEMMGQSVLLGRVGEASEAGDVIAFLCSARASYVTGASVNVDGGNAPVV